MQYDPDRDLSYLPEKAQKIIHHLKMANIPHEGPWFLETHKSPDIIEGVLATRYPETHYAYTAIYAMITDQDFSAMHKLKTDELWHFYEGGPLELLLLHPDGSGETVILGSDLLNGEHPQYLVPAGVWMGAIPMGKGEYSYSLIGNTLSPGFEYEDYTPGERDTLINEYPDFAEAITARTRTE